MIFKCLALCYLQNLERYYTHSHYWKPHIWFDYSTCTNAQLSNSCSCMYVQHIKGNINSFTSAAIQNHFSLIVESVDYKSYYNRHIDIMLWLLNSNAFTCPFLRLIILCVIFHFLYNMYLFLRLKDHLLYLLYALSPTDIMCILKP